MERSGIMKIVFFGTPAYVLPILEKLNKVKWDKNGERPIVAVVTQRPMPAGRDKKLSFSAIDTWAHKRKVPIYFEPHELIKNKVSADIGILASYGQITAQDVLKHFSLGILNIHPSLLPAFRGPTPVPATILTDSPAGGTIIKLDSKMDHGPIVTKFKDEIKKTDTTQTLRDRIFATSAEVLVELLPAYIQGKIKLKSQDDSTATYTKLMKKEYGYIPLKAISSAIKGETIEGGWSIPFVKNLVITYSPINIERFIRAATPWPGGWTQIKTKSGETKRLKIISAGIDAEKLVIFEVQVEGKNPVSWKQFNDAYKTDIDL